MIRARLYLITPATIDLATFPAMLEAALGAGDVASLLIAGEAPGGSLQEAAERLVPIAQARGVAVLVLDDARVAARAKADGVHVEGGLDEVSAAVKAFRPGRIVGAGGLVGRDDAMAAGELGIDYVFFGRLDRPETPEGDDRLLDLAEWWSDLMQPPCVVLAGADLAAIGEAAATGADFVAVRSAIWDHLDGPAAAVAAANRALTAAALEPGS